MTVLSARAEKAVSILKDGGYFRHALVSGFRGREQFKTRLYTKERRPVRGIGIQTRFELEDAGMLEIRECAPSSTWPTEYVIREGA